MGRRMEPRPRQFMDCHALCATIGAHSRRKGCVLAPTPDPITKTITDKLYGSEPEPSEQYVIIVTNRYDRESVDAVIGPFDTLEASRAWAREHLDGGSYRPYSTERLRMELPEWAT